MSWLAAALAATAFALGVNAPLASARAALSGRALNPAAWSHRIGLRAFRVGMVPLLGVGVCLSALHGRRLALGLIGLGVVFGVLHLFAEQRSRSAAERRGATVLAVCDGIAADLGAGQPPEAALRRAAVEWPEFAPVASAAQLGSDVPMAIRSIAAEPGAAQLVPLAAAWQVAHRSGSGLAAATGRAADSIRAQRGTARLVRAELGSAHATARMMAVLPLGVLALGSGVGGDPVGFLLDTVAGLGCLATGLLLSFLGLLWLHRIAEDVLA